MLLIVPQPVGQLATNPGNSNQSKPSWMARVASRDLYSAARISLNASADFRAASSRPAWHKEVYRAAEYA